MSKFSRGRQADGAPNPIDQHVGHRMRIRRKLLGLSQAELGEKLGLTFQQIQKYERGANRIGSSRLYDLSQALDVSISFFFDDLPDEAAVLSPASQCGTRTVPHISDEDALSHMETKELLAAYYGISDPKIRGRVYALAKALGGPIDSD